MMIPYSFTSEKKHKTKKKKNDDEAKESIPVQIAPPKKTVRESREAKRERKRLKRLQQEEKRNKKRKLKEIEDAAEPELSTQKSKKRMVLCVFHGFRFNLCITHS